MRLRAQGAAHVVHITLDGKRNSDGPKGLDSLRQPTTIRAAHVFCQMRTQSTSIPVVLVARAP